MKYALCFLLSVFCFSALGQDTNAPPVLTNILVNFKPDNYPYPGITNYPIPGPMVDFQTNAPGWTTNMMTDQYLSYVTAIQQSAAWQTGKSLLASNKLWTTKYDARAWASNVVNGVDGQSLYLRATAEANWFYLNQIRTNLGYPALTRNAYKTMIDTNIANFGK